MFFDFFPITRIISTVLLFDAMTFKENIFGTPVKTKNKYSGAYTFYVGNTVMLILIISKTQIQTYKTPSRQSLKIGYHAFLHR